jgi:integrase
MSKAWIFQDPKQVQKRGANRASWYVGWVDPDGHRRCKSCGAGKTGRGLAEKLAKKRAAELTLGTYNDVRNKLWKEFRQEYETKIAPGKAPSSQRLISEALDKFEEIIHPARLTGIRTQTIDAYRAKRRTQKGMKGAAVSPATVNKELRLLHAVLATAKKWGYLKEVPHVDFEREPEKLPIYITPEDFATLYAGCDNATLPDGYPFTPADWWRGLLVMAYMTGWRIGEILALRREDLDLDQGEAITRARNNKGKRDERAGLHELVVQHLRKLASFDPLVFPWNRSERVLYVEFGRIQKAAGIHLACTEEHVHSDTCYMYTFHDFRRAFATMNTERVSAVVLQKLMRHQSFSTTQGYINMVPQMRTAVEKLYVPTLPLAAAGQG